MYYRDEGFRAFYKRFAVFALTDRHRQAMEDYPDMQRANGMLVYGYIDENGALTLEVLAAVLQRDEIFECFDPPEKVSYRLGVDKVKEEEFSWLDHYKEQLLQQYAKPLERLAAYDVSKEMELSREIGYYDASRHPYYPDDIQVCLQREGCQDEICWARLAGKVDRYITATLLNKPKQNFGYYKGELIAVLLEKNENEQYICYADKLLTPADLEDGSMLRTAIADLLREGTKQRLIDLLMILRDSWVWIPCNAVFSQADQEMLKQMAEQTHGNVKALVGTSFTTQEDVRLVPDILQSGEEFFFPVFITRKDMGQYGVHFSKLQKHFVQAITMAKNNPSQVSGIVINAFSESQWILKKELFEFVEAMNSRLISEIPPSVQPQTHI